MPDVQRATELIDDLCSSGFEALTISLVHSYATPEHERRLREIVVKRHPHIPVSLSWETLPASREYDRAITTMMNDYVHPTMKRLDIANAVMRWPLRVTTARRGLDPREFGLVAFGGAGSLHANAGAK